MSAMMLWNIVCGSWLNTAHWRDKWGGTTVMELQRRSLSCKRVSEHYVKSPMMSPPSMQMINKSKAIGIQMKPKHQCERRKAHLQYHGCWLHNAWNWETEGQHWVSGISGVNCETDSTSAKHRFSSKQAKPAMTIGQVKMSSHKPHTAIKIFKHKWPTEQGLFLNDNATIHKKQSPRVPF